MKMKRMAALFLALIFSITSVTVGASALDREKGGDVRRFTPVNTYTEGQFEDVPAGSWCASNVKEVYELGLMGGKTTSFFDATGNLTIAQTIVTAVRMFCIYYGVDEPKKAESPWYANYLELAEKYDIVTKKYDNYDVPITRAEFAQIMRNTYPDGPLQEMNYIPDGVIPDVPMDAEYAGAVYKLYRAGILTGSDAKGTFYPDTYITRGAAAAIVSRQAKHSLRKQIMLSGTPQTIYMYAEQSTIAVGEQTMVVARVMPALKDYVRAASITSSNPEIVAVTPEGLATGIAPGTAVITATSANGAKESITITVDPNHTPAKWYEMGGWVVGKDIPAGKYFVTSDDYTKTRSGICGIYEGTDVTNKDKEVWKHTVGYYQNFVVLEVKEGQSLYLNYNSKATQLENVDCFTANSQGYFGPGAYLVGETIPAGTYQLFQMSPSAQTYAGFYCIYHNIDSGLLDIVKNGYFDFYGSKSITLKEGQILELNYGYMKAVS